MRGINKQLNIDVMDLYMEIFLIYIDFVLSNVGNIIVIEEERLHEKVKLYNHFAL